MKKIILFLALVFLGFFSYELYQKLTTTPKPNIPTVALEYAYFEGQKDALNGEIKIAQVDGCYIWTASPWDSGSEPVYDPCKSLEENFLK